MITSSHGDLFRLLFCKHICAAFRLIMQRKCTAQGWWDITWVAGPAALADGWSDSIMKGLPNYSCSYYLLLGNQRQCFGCFASETHPVVKYAKQAYERVRVGYCSFWLRGSGPIRHANNMG